MSSASGRPVQDLAGLFDLEGKVAILTGAGSGIGAQSARLLAAAGATVVVTDRGADAAERVAAEIGAAGGTATAMGLDVADAEAVSATVDRIARDVGPPEILVSSAGLSIRKPALDLDLADWDRVFQVNVTGTFLCARAVARHMMAGAGGAIVNIASIMGLSGGGPYPNASYQASKGAVVNLTRALAVEWAASGIRVNAVAPTWVDTPFIGALKSDADAMARIQALMPMGRIATSEEVAAAVLFLASPASSMTTGHILAVDGGFLAQ